MMIMLWGYLYLRGDLTGHDVTGILTLIKLLVLNLMSLVRATPQILKVPHYISML